MQSTTGDAWEGDAGQDHLLSEHSDWDQEEKPALITEHEGRTAGPCQSGACGCAAKSTNATQRESPRKATQGLTQPKTPERLPPGAGIGEWDNSSSKRPYVTQETPSHIAHPLFGQSSPASEFADVVARMSDKFTEVVDKLVTSGSADRPSVIENVRAAGFTKELSLIHI